MVYILLVILYLVLIGLITMYLYMNLLKKKELLYEVDGLNKLTKDIIYKTVDDKNLKMDIYKPINLEPEDKLPVVVFVHGEGPELFIRDAKDWGVYTGYGKLLSSKGFVAVTFNHRYAGSSYKNIKDISKDVTDAVDYIKNNADQYNIDVDRICVWSFSLGGLYSSLFLKENRAKCVVSYYGLLDVYSKVKKEEDTYQEFTPRNYLKDVKNTAILVVKAEKDRIKAINKSIDNFIEAAKEYKVNYQYIVHKTGGHSFDVLNDNEETREVIGQTIKFIEENC